jgi:hypothetical protein
VEVEDLAGNPATTTTLVGPEVDDDEPVIREDDTKPLRAVLSSNRPNYPGLAKETDVITISLDMSAVVSISAAVVGPASNTAGSVSW